MKGISKEAREYLAATLRYKGEIPKSEVIEMIRPLYTFDPDALMEKAISNAAASIIRSIKCSDGTRRAYILKGEDTVIDIETCTSIDKVKKVAKALQHHRESTGKSEEKAWRRVKQLEGQFSLFSEEVSTDG